jgi:hypothetical protein
MFCSSCGKKREGRFCSSCGTDSNSEVAPLQPLADAQPEIIFEDGANHFRGKLADGGRIYLLRSELRFVPHSFNIPGGEISFGYEQISELKRVKTMGLVPNGVLIVLKGRQEHRFVVNHPSNFMNAITSLCSRE